MRAHGRFSRGSLAAILLGLSVAIPASAQAGQRDVRIDNFARVDATYYRGGQPEGQDYADLAALGVKTVLNLTSDDAQPNEQAIVAQAGMTYLQIPMTTHTVPTDTQISQFLKIVNNPANHPVYVHCVGGRHRTGVMTAIYRMTHDGWTADRAFAEMKQYKFGADFLHAEFKNFVYAYPAQLARAAAVNADTTATTKADAKSVK